MQIYLVRTVRRFLFSPADPRKGMTPKKPNTDITRPQSVSAHPPPNALCAVIPSSCLCSMRGPFFQLFVLYVQSFLPVVCALCADNFFQLYTGTQQLWTSDLFYLVVNIAFLMEKKKQPQNDCTFPLYITQHEYSFMLVCWNFYSLCQAAVVDPHHTHMD